MTFDLIFLVTAFGQSGIGRTNAFVIFPSISCHSSRDTLPGSRLDLVYGAFEIFLPSSDQRSSIGFWSDDCGGVVNARGGVLKTIPRLNHTGCAFEIKQRIAFFTNSGRKFCTKIRGLTECLFALLSLYLFHRAKVRGRRRWSMVASNCLEIS